MDGWIDGVIEGWMDGKKEGRRDGGMVGWCGIFGGGSSMVALDCLRRGFVAAAEFLAATQNSAHRTDRLYYSAITMTLKS